MYSVILVDDQPFCLRGMESAFDWKKHGFEIIYKTTNPEIALEMIKELNPDVLCTDMRMPQISGLDLIKAAKTINESIECIIVSGYEDFEKACEAMRYRVFRYCLKPLDKKDTENILSELRKHLDKKNTEASSSLGIGSKAATDIHNPKFKNMLTYINEHFSESLSLEELSVKFDINATFASRLFTQYFNMGYSSYLTTIRLQKSVELLKTTKLSIEKISYTVGFNDPSYFCKTFKKHYNETPYKYRFANSLKGEADDKNN